MSKKTKPKDRTWRSTWRARSKEPFVPLAERIEELTVESPLGHIGMAEIASEIQRSKNLCLSEMEILHAILCGMPNKEMKPKRSSMSPAMLIKRLYTSVGAKTSRGLFAPVVEACAAIIARRTENDNAKAG